MQLLLPCDIITKRVDIIVRGSEVRMRSKDRQARHDRLVKLLDAQPLLSDRDLARELGVSVATIRLDRGVLNVPELRLRTRAMAENASTLLTSIRPDEVVGDIVDIEPDRHAISVLHTGREHAWRQTELVSDQVVYLQAASLAIAVIKEELVIVGSARSDFKQSARVGDLLTAYAKVGVSRDDRAAVSVRTLAGDALVYVGRFVVRALDRTERGLDIALRA